MDAERVSLLTRRESEILSLIALGKSSKEIATQLDISLHTVNNHRKHMCKKLGCENASQLIVYATTHCSAP